MATFKTTDEIIQIVYGLLGSISIKKYMRKKPTSANDAEYIVINCLPIPANVMQIVIFNVNYHTKDLASGVPDISKLTSNGISILNLLQKVTGPNYLIDFESQDTISEEPLGESFTNLRFSFKYINN